MAQTLTLLMLGTGTTGASIGLALRRAGENFQRIGYDPDPQTLRKAQQLGAVDRIVNNPAGAASEADLVLLNLPGPNSLPTVEAIAGRLKADTVVLSTAGLHGPAMDPVRERLAPNHPCVAAVPFLGPLAALFDAEGEASADRFDGGMLGIVAPQGTPEGAVEICMDLAMVLHATPFFLEAAELDSVTATSEEIPSLLAAAAVESLQVNPGWRDQRRLVGRPFARLASLVGGKAGSELASELIFNRGPLISRLDALAEELGALRRMLESADQAGLTDRLNHAAAIYHEWRSIRLDAQPDHGVETPPPLRTSLFDRLVGGLGRPAAKKP